MLPKTFHDTALLRAEDLCSRFRNLSVRVDETNLKVTASFGVASYPAHGSTREEVFPAADLEVYQAKKQGRDRVVAAQLPEAVISQPLA